MNEKTIYVRLGYAPTPKAAMDRYEQKVAEAKQALALLTNVDEVQTSMFPALLKRQAA